MTARGLQRGVIAVLAAAPGAFVAAIAGGVTTVPRALAIGLAVAIIAFAAIYRYARRINALW